MVESDVYDNMHPDDLPQVLTSQLENEIGSMSMDVYQKFQKLAFNKLATLVAQAGGEKMSGTTLLDDLIDFDSDGIMEIQQELVTDITAAFEKFASQAADLASHAKLSGLEP